MSRLFGTDGVRGIANKELGVELAYKLGRAGALVLTEGSHKPRILVGRDTRISGEMLEYALVAGILSTGAEAICVGVMPTPAIAFLTRNHSFDAGVVISASHNPVEFNGIKFFNGNGYKLKDELEDKIQNLIEENFKGIEFPTGKDVGKLIHTEKNAIKEYVDFVTSTVDTDFKGMKIALDCANGASYEAAVLAFNKLGADVHVMGNNPNGININDNCGSTHPEGLMEYVVKEKCDIGLAFDGDADRCLAVDEKGNLIHGDFMMCIFAKSLKDSGKLQKNTLVTTVMSNMGLDIALKEENISSIKTKVGDRYVLEEMLKDNYVIGGEQSGHIIFLEHNSTGDGLLTAVQLCNVLKSSNKKLSELASIMKELPQVLVNVNIPNDMKKIHEVDGDLKELIKNTEAKLNGKGRVLIRPSGTEPLVRVMLEGENQEEINLMAQKIADLISEKCSL